MLESWLHWPAAPVKLTIFLDFWLPQTPGLSIIILCLSVWRPPLFCVELPVADVLLALPKFPCHHTLWRLNSTLTALAGCVSPAYVYSRRRFASRPWLLLVHLVLQQLMRPCLVMSWDKWGKSYQAPDRKHIIWVLSLPWPDTSLPVPKPTGLQSVCSVKPSKWLPGALVIEIHFTVWWLTFLLAFLHTIWQLIM